MNCENLQFDLSIYLDDVLSEDERVSIEKHLPTCPLCRQKLSEYKELRNDLRVISRPVIPANLLNSVRSAVASEISQRTIQIGSEVDRTWSEKISHWIMPYSVGTVAASIFAFLMLTFILTTGETNNEFVAVNEKPDQSSILLADSSPEKIREAIAIPEDYENVSITNYQPQVNPTGALMALSKSIVRGNIKDEEVVVVADVFNNGLAKINEIVEPPSDDEALIVLRKAFQTNPEDAPFLPVRNGQDSETVRVILKIQRVDVVDLRPKKKSKKRP